MFYTDNYKKLQKQIKITPDKTSALESLNLISNDMKRQSTPIAEKKQMTKTPPIKPNYDANVIVTNLTSMAEQVIESLKGAPNPTLSSKNEYRYGRKGSLSFCLEGEKRGTWFNFETLEKGNLLHLIQKELGLDFKSSLEYAANITGDSLKAHLKIIDVNRKKDDEKKNIKSSKTQNYALQLVNESKTVPGTLAERYLKETRKIHDVSGQDIRFHPGVFTNKTEAIRYRPALLNIARNNENKIVAVEAIYLDELAKKASMDMKPKKTFGPKNGACVILNHGEGSNAVTYLTEGVETGLSVRDVVQTERVIATLGKQNLLNIDIKLLTDKVVLCLDNDGASIRHDKVILNAINRLTENGKEVRISMPSIKGDFNDLAQKFGLDRIMKTLSHTTTLSRSLYSNIENGSKIGVAQQSISIDEKSSDTQLNSIKSEEPSLQKEKELKGFEMEI